MWRAVGLGLAGMMCGAAGGGAAAAPVPPAVAAMIDASAGDAEALKAVVKAAKATNPGSAAEIDAQVAALDARAKADKEARMASQGFFEGWTGEGEAGGAISTGNTSEKGFALGLGFGKETPRWRHGIELSADYKRTEGETTQERYFGGYNLNYKFSERFYAVGLVSAEKDRFAGFRSRFVESVGLGYRLVDREGLTLDIDGGPALRQTDFYDDGGENTVAGRIAGALKWEIAPGTTFSQTASAYLESDTSTLTAASAVTTKLGGDLSARASFEVRHETDPPDGRDKTDTTSRVTLVYSF